MFLLYRNIYHTPVCLPICLFVLSISNVYIYIYITPPNIRKQSGVYLGLIDKNQFYIPFVLIAFLLFMIAHKVKCLCCLVFHIVILVIFLYIFLCYMCKSFDRKKQMQIKEPYLKYIGGETGWFLWGSWNILGTYLWAMKYFLELLMGHKS